MRPQPQDRMSAQSKATHAWQAHSVPARRADGADADTCNSELVWDLTLESSDVMRSRFLEEVESRYARTMQAAFRRDDLAEFETLRQSREQVLESVFSGDLEPWCVRLTDSIQAPLHVRGNDGSAHRVRVVLRCPAATALLYRFAATETELELLRGAIETTAGATRPEVQALLRDPRLGLLALPGANDPTRLRHAWAADATALMLVCAGNDADHGTRVVGLSEGWNSLRLGA